MSRRRSPRSDLKSEQLKIDHAAQIRERWRLAGQAVAPEQRAAFLSNALSGGLSIREAYEKTGISFDAAMGLLGDEAIRRIGEAVRRETA